MKYFLVLILLLGLLPICLGQHMVSNVNTDFPQSFINLQGYTTDGELDVLDTELQMNVTDEELAYLTRRARGYRNIATVFGVVSIACIAYGLLPENVSGLDPDPLSRVIFIGLGSISGLIGLAQSGKVSKYEKQRAELIKARNSSNQDIGFSLQLGVTNHGLGLKILF